VYLPDHAIILALELVQMGSEELDLAVLEAFLATTGPLLLLGLLGFHFALACFIRELGSVLLHSFRLLHCQRVDLELPWVGAAVSLGEGVTALWGRRRGRKTRLDPNSSNKTHLHFGIAAPSLF